MHKRSLIKKAITETPPSFKRLFGHWFISWPILTQPPVTMTTKSNDQWSQVVYRGEEPLDVKEGSFLLGAFHPLLYYPIFKLPTAYTKLLEEHLDKSRAKNHITNVPISLNFSHDGKASWIFTNGWHLYHFTFILSIYDVYISLLLHQETLRHDFTSSHLLFYLCLYLDFYSIDLKLSHLFIFIYVFVFFYSHFTSKSDLLYFSLWINIQNIEENMFKLHF